MIVSTWPQFSRQSVTTAVMLACCNQWMTRHSNNAVNPEPGSAVRLAVLRLDDDGERVDVLDLDDVGRDAEQVAAPREPDRVQQNHLWDTVRAIEQQWAARSLLLMPGRPRHSGPENSIVNPRTTGGYRFPRCRETQSRAIRLG
jgi:hypothetical protein